MTRVSLKRLRNLSIASADQAQSRATTSNDAPVSEILRTVRMIPAPPNPIMAAFKTRRRAALRFSSRGRLAAIIDDAHFPASWVAK